MTQHEACITFTPGPWVYEVYRKDDGSLACVTTVAHCCDYVIGLPCQVPGGNYRDGDPEGDPEADARLIAAAPDLYVALKALQLQALQSTINDPANEWGREALELTRAALAKAILSSNSKDAT